MESCAGRGFSADEIITGYLSAARIEAGTITASHLAAGVGQSIDLSANSTITGMQATINVMPSQIMQTVNNTYGSVKTTVEQNASSWSAKVDQNGVINAINVSTEGATINASKISLIGHTTINNGFSIDQNGYMTAKNGGSIAGWIIGTDTLYSGTGASRVGLRSGVTGDNVVIYAGSSTLASAPFRVTASGKVTCTNLTVTGGSISGTSINIGSGTFQVTTAGAVTCSNLTVTGGSISGASINIGNGAFQVTTAGVVTCSDITATGGKIGGWTIDSNRLWASMTLGNTTFTNMLKVPTSNGWTLRISNNAMTRGMFVDFSGNTVFGDASNAYFNSDGTLTLPFSTTNGQTYIWSDGRTGFNNRISFIASGGFRGFAQGQLNNTFSVGYSDGEETVGCYLAFTETQCTCNGAFYVTGNKPRIMQTDSFDKVILSAYETPTPMFGDLGDGTISDDGMIYIPIDPILAETIDMNTYYVFVQKCTDGDCWVERHHDYFVVHGTPGLVFCWEIKGKQKDLSQTRFAKYNIIEGYTNDRHTQSSIA